MASGMRTDTAVMAQTGNLATDTAAQLKGMMNALMAQLAPLEQYFRGVAGSSFQDVKAAFDEDMARLNTALHTIADAIQTAGQGYVAIDAELGEAMTRTGAHAGRITQALMINPS